MLKRLIDIATQNYDENTTSLNGIIVAERIQQRLVFMNPNDAEAKKLLTAYGAKRKELEIACEVLKGIVLEEIKSGQAVSPEFSKSEWPKPEKV